MIAGLLAPAAGRIEREGACALMAEAAALDPELPLRAALGFWAGLDGRRDAIGAALLAETSMLNSTANLQTLKQEEDRQIMGKTR